MKFVIAPLVMVISVSVKLLVASLEVKVREIEASLVALPEDTVEEVIVIVGEELSKVHVNWVAAVLALPAASVKVPAATSIVHGPFAVGVKVAM